MNTGGEPSQQWRSTEAAFEARQGRGGQPQQYSKWHWQPGGAGGGRESGQGTWYLKVDGCYNGGSSKVGAWGWTPRLNKTRKPWTPL